MLNRFWNWVGTRPAVWFLAGASFDAALDNAAEGEPLVAMLFAVVFGLCVSHGRKFGND